jgi:RNA polymerase sigma-70 factor, ECF subfamily
MEELRLKDVDERELVRKAAAGDEQAFRAMLESHYTLIYSVVRGVAGQHGETDDIVQEVFIKIFRAIGDFRGDSRLSTWIYRIARNEALNAIDRRKPQAIPIDDCEELPDAGDNPETSYRRRIGRERLERLLERLDEKQRVAIELRYLGDKSYEEIAEIMAIPLGTVKTHIYRAKLSLKRMMTGSAAKAFEKGFGET